MRRGWMIPAGCALVGMMILSLAVYIYCAAWMMLYLPLCDRPELQARCGAVRNVGHGALAVGLVGGLGAGVVVLQALARRARRGGTPRP